MSLGISAENIKNAFNDADKYRIINMAKKEFNIHHNDGMTLKIPQDNMLDLLVNTVDGRRLRLEKQAEILHDYYGDRMLAKEMFERYLGYKAVSGGVANLLTMGLLGVNLYTRVLKNSVFMGKVGTFGSIVALQAAGRHLSNNFLEKQIERPWKIHSNRMSKGLGPTNVPSNDHTEILTSPLRFLVVPFSTSDFLYGTKNRFAPSDVSFKFPILQEHYPFTPDEEDINKLVNLEMRRPKRWEKMEPEDDGEMITIPHRAYMWYQLNNGTKALDEYNQYYELFKGFLLRGNLSIYKPETEDKKVAFEARDFKEDINGTIVEVNDFSENPLEAEINADLPYYSLKNYINEVNITEDRVKLLKHHWLQRLKFKNLKKLFNDQLGKTIDLDEAKAQLDKFQEQLKEEDTKYLLQNVIVAAPDREKNFLESKQTILLFENDHNVLKEYYDLIVSTRPKMTKEVREEFSYDFDFDVDLNKYDPWEEYKLIYKDLFVKGRAYYILKSIPDWRFLQIGRPHSVEDDSYSKFNPRRPNNRDSIFSMLTIERYFNERLTKEGLYRDKSQAIRI